MNAPALKRTPFYDIHVANGAKMVPFAGYEMPVSYPLGIVKEHLHTRQNCGIFDVSHMGIIDVTGDDPASALETVVPVDLQSLQPGQQKYALLTNDNGGIRDDLMVARLQDRFVLVVNAACKHEDLEYLQDRLSSELSFKLRDDLALLAVQGPRAEFVMSEIGMDLSTMTFMNVLELELDGVNYVISRSGYTGEDGFEISLPVDSAPAFLQKIMAVDEAELIGLGARDTLRLEAGLCLYGHDLDTSTTPVEASLNWALSPARREDGQRSGGYPGYQVIHEQFPSNIARKRVGLVPEGRAPVREGTRLFNDDEEIGIVTSGGFSPSLGHPVCMGYVKPEFSAVGTSLQAEVRNKKLPLTVTKLPFVTQNYKR